MRRLLDSDFFLTEANGAESDEDEMLRVFAGPRGIVIADARVRLDAGVRVCRGAAFDTGSGIEFVLYREEHEIAGEREHALELRFVVKSAHYDAMALYSLRHETMDGGPP